MANTYRTEIDGLRAIAILGVVLFHAGFKQLSGGYAGVDVFFVISGYLIGGNILDGLSRGDFSFRRFYSRRARRILPALIAMVLVVMILGWFTMMPDPYRYLGGAAVTALISLSNVWFLNRIDYFNPEAAQDPLLHTWSLGVEEQFYLIIPLMLLLLWRWRPGAILPALVGLAALSFATTILTAGEFQMQAFYLLHTRGWELLAGVLVAWGQRNRPIAAAWHGPLFCAGLILILFGLWSVPPTAAWPGVWTLPVVLGTAFILAAPQAPSPFKLVLNNPAMRFLGLISYSLYLWHQPVFSLLESSQFWPSSLSGIALILIALVAISTLSWRFIEQPFRTPGPLPRFKPRMLWFGGFATLAIAIGGEVTEGYPSRLPAEVLQVLETRYSYSPTFRKCITVRAQVADFDTETGCTFGTAEQANVLIWGDSHMARLAEPLGAALPKGFEARQLTLSSCLPVAGLINIGQTRATQCPIFNDMVLDHLQAHPEITNIVIFASWKNYMFDVSGPNMYGYHSDDTFYAVPTDRPHPANSDELAQSFVDALAKQLRTISPNRHITLVLAMPRPEVDIPRYFATRMWWSQDLPEHASYSRAIYEELAAPMRAIFNRAIAQANVPEAAITLIDPADIFCDADACDLIRAAKFLYSDGNHPSLAGLDLLIPPIIEAIVTSQQPAISAVHLRQKTNH